MGVNWPELRSCFGLCSLKTGVYVVASAGMILNAISVVGYCLVFSDLVMKRRDIFRDKEHWKQQNLTDARSTLAFWTHILLGYIFTWILLKIIILLTNAFLFYGMWKNRRNLIKIYLYINFQTWILTVVNIIIISQFFNIFLKIIAVVYALLDGYKLLVVRSAYREMTGKQKFLDNPNPNVPDRGFESPPQYSQSPNSSEQQHCSSCSCNFRGNILPSPNDNTTLINGTEEVNISKELNFKENTVIFDNNQTQMENYIITSINNVTTSEEFNETAINNISLEEKNNVKDAIYDENQLNSGPSPIYEEVSHSSNIASTDIRSDDTNGSRIYFEYEIKENQQTGVIIKNKFTRILEINKDESIAIKTKRPTSLNIEK